MKIKITQHSKKRAKQRISSINSNREAERIAKQAWNCGATINKFYGYPRFYCYLLNRKKQTRTTKVRVYRNNIYIWRGEVRALVTVFPIPNRFLEEIKQINMMKQEEK